VPTGKTGQVFSFLAAFAGYSRQSFVQKLPNFSAIRISGGFALGLPNGLKKPIHSKTTACRGNMNIAAIRRKVAQNIPF
jgi:hypothetical protein